jgi:hypothetical protein
MNTAKYLIAKYVPDLMRGEPRNIGVVLWTPSGVRARFVAERPGKSGEVDGRSIPAFVASTSAFKQWVEYWQGEVGKASIMPLNGGPAVNSSDAAFLDVLAQSSKGSFVLAEGGLLLDPIRPGDEATALRDLFDALVELNPGDEVRDPSLERVCDEVIAAASLNKNPHFKHRYPVECAIGKGNKEAFEFSYGYGNGSPKRLYQRVPMRNRGMLSKTVDATAWMFEKVVAGNIVPEDDAVSLIYVAQDQKDDQEIARGIRVLGSVSRVVNLHDDRAALREFKNLPVIEHK